MSARTALGPLISASFRLDAFIAYRYHRVSFSLEDWLGVMPWNSVADPKPQTRRQCFSDRTCVGAGSAEPRSSDSSWRTCFQGCITCPRLLFSVHSASIHRTGVGTAGLRSVPFTSPAILWPVSWRTLASILENMRKDGHNPLPEELKQEIRKRVHRPLVGDRRLDSDFILRDEHGRQSFYANDVFSAVN